MAGRNARPVPSADPSARVYGACVVGENGWVLKRPQESVFPGPTRRSGRHEVRGEVGPSGLSARAMERAVPMGYPRRGVFPVAVVESRRAFRVPARKRDPRMAVRTIVVIPARFGSERLRGKPLLPIGDKPLIQHVYERARAARGVARVCVATDDERIEAAVRGFGGEAVRTRADHRSGTDRVAEVAAAEEAELVVNVQADLPFIESRAIEELVARLVAEPELRMATVCTEITDLAEYENPHVVKVVFDQQGHALYFSRSPIPFWRGGAPVGVPLGWKHVGLYAFRRDFLLRFAELEPSPLESAESLEQLRVLERGFRIGVVCTDVGVGIEVNTEEDLNEARRWWEANRRGVSSL